jgi:hypothetical protein
VARATRASACATSVGGTSPTRRRVRVVSSVCLRNVALMRCASTSDWLLSTLM